MAEKLDPKELARFQELLMANSMLKWKSGPVGLRTPGKPSQAGNRMIDSNRTLNKPIIPIGLLIRAGTIVLSCVVYFRKNESAIHIPKKSSAKTICPASPKVCSPVRSSRCSNHFSRVVLDSFKSFFLYEGSIFNPQNWDRHLNF